MTSLCKKLFGRKKKSNSFVDFYSIQKGVSDIFPITRSSSLKRNYQDAEYKNTDAETKNCPGIKHITSAGWIVPAPADFVIKTNGDGVSLEWHETYRFSKGDHGMEGYISTHTDEQSEPLLSNPEETLKTVVKVETPWRFNASDDIVLLQIPVSYNNESRFQAATGILDPRYSHYVNIQLFWKVMNDSTVVSAGTPLCQLIPISRKVLNLSTLDVTIRDADNEDLEKEKAINYAINCVILSNDSLSSRLSRTMSILNKFKNRRN